MSKLELSIGCSPWGAECTQLGTLGYFSKAQTECRAFISQLKRHYAAAHGGATPPCDLAVKHNRHDFGIYFDVVARHEEGNEGQRAAAYWLEAHTPEDWDVEAAAEIGLFSSDRVVYA
jgi:hypothetical protein